MRRWAPLACALLTTLAAGLSSEAATNPGERKPVPAATKSRAPTKSVAPTNRPRETKAPSRGLEAGHRPVPAGNASAPSRPATAAVAPPRPERALGTAARPSSEARIAAAREVYQAGRYAEVPTALIKLLTESQLTSAQLAAVYELLASAYVALGETELAIRCFSEVLNRRPAFALDPVRTSPKIRAALDQAQAQARPGGVGAPTTLPVPRRPM